MLVLGDDLDLVNPLVVATQLGAKLPVRRAQRALGHRPFGAGDVEVRLTVGRLDPGAEDHRPTEGELARQGLGIDPRLLEGDDQDPGVPARARGGAGADPREPRLAEDVGEAARDLLGERPVGAGSDLDHHELRLRLDDPLVRDGELDRQAGEVPLLAGDLGDGGASPAQPLVLDQLGHGGADGVERHPRQWILDDRTTPRRVVVALRLLGRGGDGVPLDPDPLAAPLGRTGLGTAGGGHEGEGPEPSRHAR